MGDGDGEGEAAKEGRGIDDEGRGRDEDRGIDVLRGMEEVRIVGGVMIFGATTSTILCARTGDSRSWISGRRADVVGSAIPSRSISFSTSSDISAASDCFRIGLTAIGVGTIEGGEEGKR